jgi:hypothetical protein
MLLDHVGQARDDTEFWRKLESQIWNTAPPDKPDELSQKIDQATEVVEKAVRPTLVRSPVGALEGSRFRTSKRRSMGTHSSFHDHRSVV